MQNYNVHTFVISMEFLAINCRRPSYETPLGPGAKKNGCFRRLLPQVIITTSCNKFVTQWVNNVSTTDKSTLTIKGLSSMLCYYR